MKQDGKLMDAQDMIIQDVQRLKDNDDEKTKLIMELSNNLKEVAVEQKVIKKDVNELKQKVQKIETSTTKTNTDVEKLKDDMKVVKEAVTNKTWQPKDIAIVVVAVIALVSSVSSALIAALFK